MGFLRRILGGGGTGSDTGSAGDRSSPGSGGSNGDEDEAERDRRLLREEAERLDQDLLQRQLRWADRAWTPPSQGGARRAEDRDRPAGEGSGEGSGEG